jgi:hypothetical protein
MPPLAIIDAREIDEPTSGDEVLALYLSYAEPGDVVTLHRDHCPTSRDAAWRCRCIPQTLTVGARA